MSGGWPKETPPDAGGFESYQERMEGAKIRVRSDSFADHFSQATMFYRSMSAPEQAHIAAAYTFELGKVTKPEIRERTVNEILANIDADLAARVASALGLAAPKPGNQQGKSAGKSAGMPQPSASPALSLLNRVKPGIATRKIALLSAPGGDGAMIRQLRDALAKAGAQALLVAPTFEAFDGLVPDATIVGMPSVMFDAVFLPGGEQAAQTLAQSGDARHFVSEAFKHLKAIGAVDTGRVVLNAAQLPDPSDGVAHGDAADVANVLRAFIDAAGQHRIWSRAAQAESVAA